MKIENVELKMNRLKLFIFLSLHLVTSSKQSVNKTMNVQDIFSKKSSFSKTRFFDPHVKDWKLIDSVENCWQHCEENVTDCKAISYFIPTNKCQFFINDSLPQIYDTQFISYTTQKGL